MVDLWRIPLPDLRGCKGRAPPGGQYSSCNFGENLATLYMLAPPGGLSSPPRGNPGSATVIHHMPGSCHADRLVVYPITVRSQGSGYSQTPGLRSIPKHDRENDFHNYGLITFRCKATTYVADVALIERYT